MPVDLIGVPNDVHISTREEAFAKGCAAEFATRLYTF